MIRRTENKQKDKKINKRTSILINVTMNKIQVSNVRECDQRSLKVEWSGKAPLRKQPLIQGKNNKQEQQARTTTKTLEQEQSGTFWKETMAVEKILKSE